MEGTCAALLVCLCLVTLIQAEYKNDADYDRYLEFAASEDERGLFPSIFNLASSAIISANATCGQQGPESYCKLVEHVFMRSPQCDICDANSVLKRHPIELAIDGTNKWWQSPSLANGLDYERITITLDLRQEYQVAYVIVKSAIAPRPGTWALERSVDGETWLPWQYYATHDSQCMKLFGVPATRGLPRFERDDQVVCTSYFSKLDPIEHGEIHTSLVNGRPGVDGPSLVLQEFTKARYVRLRLLKLRTLNADLMIITNGRHGRRFLDKSVTRRYFYAIKDISIGGQCICYGHADSCPIDSVTGQFRCECKHNTCGESCNKCCPLFNALPWMQGTNTEPHICQPCQCFSHADSCHYDEQVERDGLSVSPDGIFEGGGVCDNCQHNTQGTNCEECKDFYYRPSGISHYREDACRPCDCDLEGSVDGTCIKDDTRAVQDLNPGDCVCKTGFGGRRCDRCALGFRNYPTCEPCPCNQAGSANYATCEDTCICKDNVDGVYCDRCKPGFINLDVANPGGCQSCFCFGITDDCMEVEWGKEQIRDLRGWNLTDMDGRREVSAMHENGNSLTYNSKKINDRSLYYWKAPPAYTDSLLNSYSGLLHYYVYYVPEEEGPATPLADVIIEGNGIKIEYHSRQQFFERENVSIQVRLHESEGWYNSDTRQPLSKRELMRVLADVQMFLVRAMYHHYQIQSSLYGVSLDVAVPDSDAEATTTAVEKCTCPANFTGNSCESCIDGFRRVGNILYDGQCVKCSCNAHSSTCDPYSGHCTNCQHNTTGTACQLCLQGYYGNPILGGEAGSCMPCGCPLTNPENNFSATCAVAELGTINGGGGYVCTSCQRGYLGPHCGMCDDGYFGDPKAVNGSCARCECNGNIDEQAIGNCDSQTGECLKCIYNTEGEHCEKCKENYYGSAFDKTCRDCGCHLVGSSAAQCNNATGECDCNEFYEGIQCDRCQEGHGDVDNGCPMCMCNSTGSSADWCDAVSGQCQCKYGVFGKRCDTCKTGYFGFTEQGCQFCGCDEYGSEEGGSCDPIDGQCICRQNVTGQMCDQCKEGYFNISSGEGCHECLCDGAGAEDSVCNLVSGQCTCKTGVTGLKCDKCGPNHYGLSDEGCKECPVCPAPGQVCDPETGECVCPPNTVGEMCENCTENAWNYHPLRGCVPCDCNQDGSDQKDCDLFNGQCNCRDGYTGLACDSCTHGHFDFPDCRKCKCVHAGTDPSACKKGMNCACDDDGQCPCKKNTEGEKCQKCTAHSFSLEKHNPSGCTQCFCSNRTNFCIQGSYIWQQIYAQNRHAMFIEPYLYYKEVRGYRIFPDDAPTINSYPTDYTPIYWSMPKKFGGDRVTSYNGFIRFRAQNVNDRYSPAPITPEAEYYTKYPLVVLVGSHRIVLEYYPKGSPPENGRYKIRLREDLWKSKSTPELAVTRKQLMVALQNLQEIYVRGTFAYYVSDATLSDITLDVAVSVNTTEGLNNTAIGVETCGDCPQGYAGTSCQTAAQGYCRKRKADYLDSEDDLDLLGWSEPCKCSGHSNTCDPETCRCTDCLHNTEGDFCERCASGYYGDARDGTPDSCTKCACPLADNSFSPTCHATSHMTQGYVCDACEEGYTGMFCERCLDGYYGDPSVPGGRCLPCDCHLHGSLHSLCDSSTGQCQCRPAVTGRDCSECQARHALVGAHCTSCDQGCTLVLMQEVDGLENTLSSQNFSGLVPVPWKGLGRIENRTYDLEKRLEDINKGKEEAKQMVDSLGDTNKYLTEAKGVASQAEFVLERINASIGEMNEYMAGAADVTQIMQNIYGRAYELVLQLRHYAQHGSDPGRPIDAAGWLTESEEHLKAMKERDEYIDKRYHRAQAELQDAKELLENVKGHQLNDTTFEQLYDEINKFSELVELSRDTLWDLVRRDALSAQKINQINTKSMDNFENTVSQINNLNGEAEDHLQSAADKVDGAKEELILKMYDDFKESNETLLPALINATGRCEMFTNQYNDLLSKYRSDYVFPAQDRADQLERQSDRIQKSFRATKDASESAVQASAAYQDIVVALKNASEAGEQAKEAAENTYKKAYPDDEESLVDSAEKAKNESLKLQAEAAKLEPAVDELETELEGYKKRLGDVNEEKIADSKRVDEIKRGYTKFDDHHDQMEAVYDKAAQAHQKAKTTEADVDEIADQVDKMAEQVDGLTGFTGAGIRELTDQVSQTAEEVATGIERVKSVEAQALANDEQVNDLGLKLAQLKEKIKEAREKASRIKIAVQSDSSGQCRRTYMSPAYPTPANRLHVKYRPLETVPDSLILLTKTKRRRTQPSEYLALELKDKRVLFHWDIGGGERMITNTLSINPIPESDQTTWYSIDVKREGNGAMLNVSKIKTSTEDGVDAVIETRSVQESFEGDVLIFNTVPGETLIELGVESLPESIFTPEFRGAIGDIILDGKKLSLWGFHSTTEQCSGAVKPEVPLKEGFMLRDGYAQYDVKSNQYSEFSIVIRFSAYSPNGLLYFRGDEDDGDFVSVELRDGNIVMQFYLGGESHLRLQTERVYNDGRVHMIFASREAQKGSVDVRTAKEGNEDEYDTETVEGNAEGNMKSLDVGEASHFVGGVPSTYNTTIFDRFDVAFDGFYGCVFDIKATSSVRLDLKVPEKSLNFEPGCTEADGKLHSLDRVVSFEPKDSEAGYFVLEGVELTNNDSTLAFGFRTRQANAALFYQSSRVNTYRRRTRETTKQQGFITIYLSGGDLKAHLGTDAKDRSKLATLSSQSTYNDGLLHSMLLRRNGDQLTLLVDDRVEQTATLKDGATIGSCERGCDQVFLGGVPQRIRAPIDELPTKTPLEGCISDFYFNYKRKPLVPQELRNSYIGVCHMKMRTPAPTEPPTAAEEPLQADSSWAHVKTNRLQIESVEPTLELSDSSRATLRPDLPPVKVTTTTAAPIVTTAPMTCHTPKMRTAEREGALRYGITESSHSKLNFKPPYPNTENMSVSFSFKTNRPDGLLFMWANYKQYTRIVKLVMNDSQLQFHMQGGKSNRLVILKFAPEVKHDDDQWHTVNVIKKQSEATFQVDSMSTSTKKAPKAIKPTLKRIFIGDVLSSHRKNHEIGSPRFHGCLSDFEFNQQKQDLVEHSRDVISCVPPRDGAIYVHSGGFLTYDAPGYPSGELKFQARFRTDEPSGYIFTLARSKTAAEDHLSVQLVDGQVRAVLAFEGQTLAEIFVRSSTLCDGAWHRANVHLFEDTLQLAVDGMPPVSVSVENWAAVVTKLERAPVHVAGLPGSALKRMSLQDSFKGCVNDLQGSTAIELQSAKKEWKTIPNGCLFE